MGMGMDMDGSLYGVRLLYFVVYFLSVNSKTGNKSGVLEPLLAMATTPTSAAEAKDLVQKLRSDPDNVVVHQLVRGACTADAWPHMSEAGYVEFFIEYMGCYEHGDMRSVRVPSTTPLV